MWKSEERRERKKFKVRQNNKEKIKNIVCEVIKYIQTYILSTCNYKMEQNCWCFYFAGSQIYFYSNNFSRFVLFVSFFLTEWIFEIPLEHLVLLNLSIYMYLGFVRSAVTWLWQLRRFLRQPQKFTVWGK